MVDSMETRDGVKKRHPLQVPTTSKSIWEFRAQSVQWPRKERRMDPLLQVTSLNFLLMGLTGPHTRKITWTRYVERNITKT